MPLLAWFAFLAALGLYYRFLLILFKQINESRILKFFYSVVGFLFTFVLAKLIQILLGAIQFNSENHEAAGYAVWFGITIGLIIIYEAILRMIIIRKEFQQIQIHEKFQEINALMYKVDESVKRGEWEQAQQLYSGIEAFDVDETEIIFRCLEFAEKHERIGNSKASQFWYEKVQ